jgi:mono/diheme cytochrome c family protein
MCLKTDTVTLIPRPDLGPAALQQTEAIAAAGLAVRSANPVVWHAACKIRLAMKRTLQLVSSVVVLIGLAGALGLYWWAGRGVSARDSPSIVEVWIAGRMRQLAMPRSARDAKNPFRPTDEVLTEARRHFADECAICHGNDGSGRTEVGRNLYPKPPDVRLPATQQLTDGELYYIIHNGIRLTGMPAWGEPEGDDDHWALALFIRHLPKLTRAEEQDMERYNPMSEVDRQQGAPETQAPGGGDARAVPGAKPQEHSAGAGN